MYEKEGKFNRKKKIRENLNFHGTTSLPGIRIKGKTDRYRLNTVKREALLEKWPVDCRSL